MAAAAVTALHALLGAAVIVHLWLMSLREQQAIVPWCSPGACHGQHCALVQPWCLSWAAAALKVLKAPVWSSAHCRRLPYDAHGRIASAKEGLVD